jgi:uncharacterized membrane protein YdbT with pleckstrin-like domain
MFLNTRSMASCFRTFSSNLFFLNLGPRQSIFNFRYLGFSIDYGNCILKYKNFTFYLDSDNKEFVIQEGILNKTKL